jgi:phosphomannomutase
MSEKDRTLARLVDDRMKLFPASGEINREVETAAELLKTIEADYESEALSIDHTDGLSMEMKDWRFNIRMSNTEPVVRLNVESRGDEKLMKGRTQELLQYMEAKSK